MDLSFPGTLAVPFLGTAVGAGFLYLVHTANSTDLQKNLNGFSAGVMTAAAIWSLILPALELAAGLGRLAFLPAVAGIWAGFLCLMAMEGLIHRLTGSGAGDIAPMILAVTLHNLPEGMAAGVAAVGYLRGTGMDLAGLFMLCLGIGLQNIPEGAIISLPLHSHGMKKSRAFALGVLSGAVEPLGTVLTLCLSWLVAPLLPFLLSFAAGTMLYVVVRELVPQASDKTGCLAYLLGFSAMMLLDTALG